MNSTLSGVRVLHVPGFPYLPAKHDVEVVRGLSLPVYILPPTMAVVRHAIRERPNFRMGPVFRQSEHVLEKVDLCGVHRERGNRRECRQVWS